ncbi:unnamed protein product, partial [Polarella glacialis]
WGALLSDMLGASFQGRIVPLRDSAPPCTVSSLLGMFPPEELSASHPVARPRRRSGRGAQGAFAPCSTLPLPADERPLEDLLRDLGVGEVDAVGVRGQKAKKKGSKNNNNNDSNKNSKPQGQKQHPANNNNNNNNKNSNTNGSGKPPKELESAVQCRGAAQQQVAADAQEEEEEDEEKKQ